VPNYACFWHVLIFFEDGLLKFLDMHYKTWRRFDQRAKFCADRPTEVSRWKGKKCIWGKT